MKPVIVIRQTEAEKIGAVVKKELAEKGAEARQVVQLGARLSLMGAVFAGLACLGVLYLIAKGVKR